MQTKPEGVLSVFFSHHTAALVTRNRHLGTPLVYKHGFMFARVAMWLMNIRNAFLVFWNRGQGSGCQSSWGLGRVLFQASCSFLLHVQWKEKHCLPGIFLQGHHAVCEGFILTVILECLSRASLNRQKKRFHFSLQLLRL